MTRLDSRNALLARTIFASTCSDKRDTTLAPNLQAGGRRGQRRKDERGRSSAGGFAPRGIKSGHRCLTRNLCCTRAANQSAKLLRKIEVSRPALLFA